jgi:hypothetical protein
MKTKETASKALWEIDHGDNRFVACVDCAYKYLVELYEGSFILEMPVLNKNYRDEDNGVYVTEDFFNEHAEGICGEAHTCTGCNIEIGK